MGYRVPTATTRCPPTAAGTLVLKSVDKRFNGTRACAAVSLHIHPGEFYTLLGPSGCGKTTLLRLVAGFLRPDSGSIHLGDREITLLPPEKRSIGMVFQDYALFPFMTVAENVTYGLRVQKKSRRTIRTRTAHYLDMVGLSGFDDRPIADLSGGEQQRVALARSLATEPQVLLLDEPLSNLDARLRERMRREIKSLQRSLGITTIFVTHDRTEALTLSDRITVLDKGRCVQTGTPDHIYSQPQSSFVARFIGDTNLFEATIENGTAVMSPDLTLQLPGRDQRGPYLSIRPQDVRLSLENPQAPNTFAGTLAEMQMSGVEIEYRIAVLGIDLYACELNTSHRRLAIQPGDRLYVTLPPENIAVLEV